MLSTVFERIRDGVIALDRNWRYTYVNPQAAHMLGRSDPSDLIGKHALTEFPDGMNRPWGQAYARAMATQQPEVLEGHNVAMDRWFLSRIYPSPDGLTVYVTEITEQKRAERELRESIAARERAEKVLRDAEERLQRAVSAGNIGLWDWNQDTDEVYFSPEWKHQLGYAEGELAPHVDEWRDRLHPDDLEPTLEALAAYRASPDTRVWDRQFRMRHKDGSYRSILARGQLIRDESGQQRMVGTHVDVTERTVIEKQLQRAQRMESVGRLAGGIAHDFNNVLMIINNYAEMVIDGLKDKGILLDRALAIRRAGGRAAALTQQLLAFSRQQALKPVTLNLLAIVEEMAPMLRRLIGEHITLVVGGDPDVACVSADPGQIDQVIMNLAINARDAMPDGGRLSITVTNNELDSSHGDDRMTVVAGRYVELDIRDTGTGMPDVVRERIFEPFFTTKELGRGTGLGLPMVYGIVKQSGGYIWVDSRENHGSSIRIFLPAVAGKPEAPQPAKPAVIPRGSESVLVVEDDSDVRVLTALMATSAGYRVSTAGSGEEALRALETSQEIVDLVVTDVVMPGMGGRRFAELLRHRWPDVKVLYMSGYIDDRKRTIDPGEHFIGKPFTAASLLRKIRDILDA